MFHPSKPGIDRTARLTGKSHPQVEPVGNSSITPSEYVVPGSNYTLTWGETHPFIAPGYIGGSGVPNVPMYVVATPETKAQYDSLPEWVKNSNISKMAGQMHQRSSKLRPEGPEHILNPDFAALYWGNPELLEWKQKQREANWGPETKTNPMYLKADKHYLEMQNWAREQGYDFSKAADWQKASETKRSADGETPVISSPVSSSSAYSSFIPAPAPIIGGVASETDVKRGGKLEFKSTSNWDGSYPPPAGSNGVLPPSAVGALGETYYRFQSNNGAWTTSKVPFELDTGNPALAHTLQTAYEGVVQPVVANPTGAALPSWLPRAEQGKSGVFNGVFVNEKGMPLSEYKADWTPPSWITEPPKFTPRPGQRVSDFVANYPSRWLPGMKIDEPLEHLGSYGAKIEPGIITSEETLMNRQGRGRADLPHEVITSLKYGETKAFTLNIEEGDKNPSLGVAWYGGWEASVRAQLFDSAGKLVTDYVSGTPSFGLLTPGNYRLVLTGAEGFYPKDGSGTTFLVRFATQNWRSAE